MTRTSRFAALGVFACGIVWGAPRPETSTYVDGTVSTLKPNTGGTLVFSDERSIVFRTGLAEVAVPYSGIRRAELGATQVHAHDAPAYKVWTLPQRMHKTETQLLTLEFVGADSQGNTMTLELAKPAASNVLAAIKSHTGAGANSAKSMNAKPGDSAWWGDSYWKTNTNAAKWDAANIANGTANGTANAGSK
jgi:hypothetical protein